MQWLWWDLSDLMHTHLCFCCKLVSSLFWWSVIQYHMGFHSLVHDYLFRKLIMGNMIPRGLLWFLSWFLKYAVERGKERRRGRGNWGSVWKKTELKGKARYTQTKLKCGIEMKIVLENDLITDQCNLWNIFNGQILIVPSSTPAVVWSLQ